MIPGEMAVRCRFQLKTRTPRGAIPEVFFLGSTTNDVRGLETAIIR